MHCSHFLSVVYDNMVDRLHDSITSGELVLTNLSLNNNHFTTICHTLRGNHDIVHLDLTGESVSNQYPRFYFETNIVLVSILQL